MITVTMTPTQAATALQCFDTAIKALGVNAFDDRADMRGTIAAVHNALMAYNEEQKKPKANEPAKEEGANV